jgi:hypothetical protein
VVLLHCEIFFASPTINVYKSVSDFTGFSEFTETHDRLWKMLKDLRDEIGIMEELDGWEPEKYYKPTYKGCEPLILGFEPVRCNQNS